MIDLDLLDLDGLVCKGACAAGTLLVFTWELDSVWVRCLKEKILKHGNFIIFY